MPPSQRPFIGATPYDAGVTFRVWAPFARSVAVAGDFNGWSANAHPLFSENNGYWSTDVPGAALGAQYKFCVVDASGSLLWRNDPYARSIIHNYGNLNSVIAPSDETYITSGYSTPAWNEMVIYELHIGSFVFDPASPRRMGSFDAAIGKLDYLRDLGINAIEIMAIAEFEGDISWGYNPAYSFAIEDEYGGPNAFRNFVNEAHRRGIAIILDVVYNHLGYPSGDMWRFDGWSQSGKGGIYFYNDWRSTTGWGETRFDYGRGEVRQYLRDNALRWLEQRFVDGLRWDSVGSIRNVKDQNNDPADDIPDGWSLMQWINSLIGQRQPWKISIAEDLKDNDWITKDTGSGGAGFDAQWGAAFLWTVRGAIISPNDSSRDMQAVANVVVQTYNGNAFERVIYTESHDADSNGQSRVPEMIWPGNAGSWYSQKRSTLGGTLVLTCGGIPMLFMGQEFLESGWFHNDPQELDWSKATTYAGIIQLYRDLIHLRRNWFNNTRGLHGQHTNAFHINDAAKVLAFHRWDQGGRGDDVVVVLNFGNQGYSTYTIGFPRDGRWRVRFNSDWNGYSPSFGNWFSHDTDAAGAARDNLPFSGNVGLGPYTAIILSQD
ncbi:MAG: 1,4-alpha-glucan branching protein [Blastocatellia bacterium]|nr:MAG: 1,4-alpha-glucan branching protein [Blastocatellia bacterium]